MLPIVSIIKPPVFLTSEDILSFMHQSGVYIILIFTIILVTAYGFMFLSRGIKYLKMLESNYTDKSILNTLEISLKLIWSLVVFFACLALLGRAWHLFWDNVWLKIANDPSTGTGYLAPFMSIVIVAVVVWLTIKFVHQILQYHAGNLKRQPKKTMNPRIALLIELLLKYFMIAFGVILTVTIGLTAIGFYNYIVGGFGVWLDRNKASLVFVVFVTIIGFFFVRVFDTFFEDMKKKETPFSPQIMDLAKVVMKYFIYLIVGITALYSFLQMFELRETGIIIVSVIIVFIGIVGAIAATSNLRNGFSGLIIMFFKPFVEGDRVRILDGIVCDVISIGMIFTRVRTIRGEAIDVPNNEILNKTILNYSRSEDYAVSISVAVPHDADKEMVKEILSSSALSTAHVVQTKVPEIFIIGMDQDRVVFEILVFTNTHKKIKHIKSELVHNISRTLKEKGIRCSVHISDHDDVERMRILKGHDLEGRLEDTNIKL